jgi:hypothetical protein
VIVTYSCGSEESLNQAEQLVRRYRLLPLLLCGDDRNTKIVDHSLVSRKMRPMQAKPQPKGHIHTDTECACGAQHQERCDSAETALAEALAEPAVGWKVGPGLLVGMEPTPSLPPLPPLIPFSPGDVPPLTDAGEAPPNNPTTAKEVSAREMKRTVEIMEPFRSAPRLGFSPFSLLDCSLPPLTPYVAEATGG